MPREGWGLMAMSPDANEALARPLAATIRQNELSMKKSSRCGKEYLVHLWELGELPVYAYWWCWRFMWVWLTTVCPWWKSGDLHWYSFQRNILEPNREHIQSIMGLSDAHIDRVVDSADYIINDWVGEADPDSDDEYILSHSNLFTVEGLEL